MKILLGKKGVDVNKMTAKTSAIHIAVKAGNVEAIRLLAQHGANMK
jgi:ankyrin repeat protein